MALVRCPILIKKTSGSEFWEYYLKFRLASGIFLDFTTLNETINEELLPGNRGSLMYRNKWFTIYNIRGEPSITVSRLFHEMPPTLLENCKLNLRFPYFTQNTLMDFKFSHVRRIIVECKELTFGNRVTCKRMVVSENTYCVKGVVPEEVLLHDYNGKIKDTSNIYQDCTIRKLIIALKNTNVYPPLRCFNVENLSIFTKQNMGLIFRYLDEHSSSIRIIASTRKWSFSSDAFIVKLNDEIIFVNENHQLIGDFI